MKRRTLSLLCAALTACVLPGCISLTAEMSLPNSGQPGALSGRIGGTWSWPQPKPVTEPDLPGLEQAVTILSAKSGKEPVSTLWPE